MEEKVCHRCDQILPISNFWKDKHQPNGYRAYCKECDGKQSNAWQKKNREKATNWNTISKQARAAKGLCRHCTSKQMPGRNICDRHYITDVASKSLGKANKEIVDILFKRFQENPYCPYTGELLVLGINAHLDHIKSQKNHPELKGDINNVEWISEQANLSKNGFNKDQFIEFCKLITSRFE
jgi:5-methylcytosine-specific restriction endonuclease McrA